jgi:sugar phosphate isomerase/epimerase
MNYAFMTFSCPQATWDQVLAMANEYGYVAVEPRLDSEHQHGVEVSADAATRQQKRQAAKDAGIDICCIATSCQYTKPDEVDQQVQDTHDRIDLAADMGAHRLRVFGGLIPDGISREQAIANVAAALRSVADHAAERDVVVCLETHDAWCDPNDVVALMKAVDHPHIAVNWDIMHPVNRGGVTMDQAFDILRPWIKYVHYHDGKPKGDGKVDLCTVGEGIIDHTTAIARLREMNYDGYMSGEWIGWDPPEVHLPREMAAIRAAEPAA